MSEEEIQRSVQAYEFQLREWNQEQAWAKNAYEYEAGFDSFITGFSQELFQASMGERAASCNSKKNDDQIRPDGNTHRPPDRPPVSGKAAS